MSLGFSYTLSGTAQYIGPMSSPISTVIKRPIHVLSNGNAVAVLVDSNISTSYVGAKDNQARIVLWESNAARTSWTAKATFNLPSGTYDSNNIHCGSVRLVDDSIYVVVRGSGFSVKSVLFPRSGSTWTVPGSMETVYTPPGNRYPLRFDLDINKVTGHIFIAWMARADADSTNKIGMDIIVRKAANNYVMLTPDNNLGSDGNITHQWGAEDVTIAVDPASDNIYTRLVYSTSCAAQSKDYGDYVGYRVVRNSDTATIGKGFIAEGFNAGRGGGRRTTYMWANANGEVSVAGVCGFDTADCFALRWKTTDPVSLINPTYTQSMPVTYSPITFSMNRNGSYWSDASAVYANNNFAVLFHDGSMFRNAVGKFDTTKGSVTWESQEYTWDSDSGMFIPMAVGGTAWRSQPAGAVYGGSRDTDSTNLLDTLLVYTNMGAYNTTESAWLAQHNRTWRAPASIVPSSGSVVGTSIPTLSINADIDMPDPRSALRGRFVLAKNSAFTVSVKTLDTTNTALVQNTHITGSTVALYEALPHALALDTGTWYIKAAQVDSFGTVGTYSAPYSFTVLHAPWGSDLSPSGSRILPYGLGNFTFTWTFHDGYEFDNQTAYRVLVTRNVDSSVVVDTGKVTGSDQFATIAIPSGAKNEVLAWQVQLWDVGDSAGSLSTPALFLAADEPSVTITYPTPGLVIDNARPTITWSVTDALGTGQASYRVYFIDSDGTAIDSGWINGSATAYTPTSKFLDNLTSYNVIVSVRDGVGIEGQQSTPFSTSWTPPATPSMTAMQADASQFDVRGKGFVRVRWQVTTTEADFLSYRLYRRYNLPNSAMAYDKGMAWQMIHEEFSVSPTDGTDTYTYLDYTAPAGMSVYYILTQTALRFGSTVESPFPSLTDSGASVIPQSAHYWLIDPDANGDPEDAMRLEGATADSYSDPYESEEVQIVGRGRHVEIGDRLGYTGQLTLPLRFIAGVNHLDDPRRQKLDLEEFRARKSALYIRSPFGDIFLASAGDMNFERIPGVGSSEFMNVTLPYREVYDSGN